MSEVTVFIRQGDPNRASKKGQKRPLSIITENDSDDSDAINCTRHQDAADCNGKENTPCCKDSPESNNTSPDGEIICKVSEMARLARFPNPVSDYKTASRLPIVGSKHHVPSLFSSKVVKFPMAQLPSETRPCVLELPPGHTSLILDTDDRQCPDEYFWKQQAANIRSLSCVTQDTQSTELQQSNQTLTVTYNDASVSCNATQINSSASSKPTESLAKSRETSERLHMPLPLSSVLPLSPSPTLNGKFSYRMWQQTSPTNNFHEVKSPTSPNSQQLPVNTSGGSPILVSVTIASSPDSDVSTDKNDSENSSLSNNNRGSLISKFTASKFSAYFSRRMSNESTGSLSESDFSDGDVGVDDSATTYLSYFRRLKETTDQLHLSTRRPSIMLWRQQCLESQTFSRAKSNSSSDISDESLTSDRKHRIDKALEWLRNQLLEMRTQDQHLARQLLSIRHDIHKLKLQRSTEEHQELIDDFQFELQELQEFSDTLDLLPIPEYGSNPLKQIGITRLNISSRRFSAC